MSDNIRIAKNTLFLYLRQILTLLIALFTSRIVLDSLGIENFGIYSVIGSVVVMLSVFSSSINQAISRYVAFELGRGNQAALKIVFSSSIIITMILALIVLIVGGLLGFWFLNNIMFINSNRLTAANYVLLFSLLTFCTKLISSPYYATIMAHERMSAYAYLSILESILNLSFAYVIIITPFDHLIIYSFYLLLSTLIMRVICGVYCTSQFSECRIRLIFNKEVLRQLSSFAGWNTYGSSVYLLNHQGLSILLNLFFGVTVNAARGIANQIENVVTSLSSNLITAFNPQITKKYANGEMQKMYNLICQGARFSFFLMLFFTIPLILEIRIILEMWLGQIPDNTVNFCRLSLITVQVMSLVNTITTGVFATGNIKTYVALIGSLALMALPLTYVSFLYGYGPIYAYICYFVVYLILIPLRVYILYYVLGLPVGLYYKNVILRCLFVGLFVSLLSTVIYSTMESGYLRLFILIISNLFFSLIVIFSIGITKKERNTLVRFAKRRLSIQTID